jgi:hypothetical protein
MPGNVYMLKSAVTVWPTQNDLLIFSDVARFSSPLLDERHEILLSNCLKMLSTPTSLDDLARRLQIDSADDSKWLLATLDGLIDCQIVAQTSFDTQGRFFDIETYYGVNVVKEKPLEVCVYSEGDDCELRDALMRMNIWNVVSDPHETCSLAVCDMDPLSADARELNHAMWYSGIPVLNLYRLPSLLRFGPLSRPGKIGCFECYQRVIIRATGRYKINMAPTPLVSSQPSIRLNRDIGTSLAVKFIVNSLFSPTPDLFRKVWILDVDKMDADFHQLYRAPECELCGDL